MKKSKILELLLELVELACVILGKLSAELSSSFPALKKYLLAFLNGAQTMINKEQLNAT